MSIGPRGTGSKNLIGQPRQAVVAVLFVFGSEFSEANRGGRQQERRRDSSSDAIQS